MERKPASDVEECKTGISHQLVDGRWRTVHVDGGDRPDAKWSTMKRDCIMNTLTGSCRCGRVQIAVRGKPKRIGICHCTDCRQESGSAFTFFAVWSVDQFESKGHTAEYSGRRFCPECGSRVFSADENEAEIKLGILKDAPTTFAPTYELWIKRRENWLKPIEGAEQFEEDRF